MYDVFFYLFAALTLASAFVGLIWCRNPVNAAMLFLVSLIGVAALFVMLEAYFLAFVQVLVYAGAVVVLFLFIIMLLDVEQEVSQRSIKALSAAAGLLAFAILVIGVAALLSSGSAKAADERIPESAPIDLKGFGELLFTSYLLPMQVTGFLLLVAMIGVIVISKRVKDAPSET